MRELVLVFGELYLMISVGVLASGSGTDLQSIIDASEQQMIDAKVSIVISDKREAFALKRARNHDIAAEYVNPDDLNKTEYDKQSIKYFLIIMFHWLLVPDT